MAPNIGIRFLSEPSGSKDYAERSMTTIDEVLARVRASIERVEPQDLAREMKRGAVVVDIRPPAVRSAEGEMPGALVIDRNVLEWRLAPSSPDRIADVEGRRVVVMCNDGYASTLAAGSLRQVGVKEATDLAGGFRAWKAMSQLA